MGVAIIVPGVSFADANLGKVNISGDVPLMGLSIVAPTSFTGASLQLGVHFFPLATTERNVEWSIIRGSEYASISSRGVLTPKDGASDNEVEVKVSSLDNPDVSATHTMKVTAGEVPVDPDLIYELSNKIFTGDVAEAVDTGLKLATGNDDIFTPWTMFVKARVTERTTSRGIFCISSEGTQAGSYKRYNSLGLFYRQADEAIIINITRKDVDDTKINTGKPSDISIAFRRNSSKIISYTLDGTTWNNISLGATNEGNLTIGALTTSDSPAVPMVGEISVKVWNVEDKDISSYF